MSATIKDRVVADLAGIMCLFNHTATPIPGFPFSPFRTPDHSSLTRARGLTDLRGMCNNLPVLPNLRRVLLWSLFLGPYDHC